jgi:hypothetical protein
MHLKVCTMRKTGNNVRLLFVVISMMLFSASCQKDLLDSTDPRDNIVGDWNCSEQGNVFGSMTYPVIITKSVSDTVTVYIDNFYKLGSGIKAYAKMNSMAVSIPSQVVDGYTISGSGTIASNYKTISFSYLVNDGSGEIDHVSAVYTKAP